MRAIAVFAVMLFASHTVAHAAEAARPNVLFIAVDDLNDWIGSLGGHPQARTPNLDRLAKRGVLFTNTHCAAPACNPSRAALMTGVPPHKSGVYVNPQPWRKSLPDAVTIPQHFMKHGYWAAGAGKIYHGRYPDPASWNDYYPSKTQPRHNDPLPAKRNINGLGRSHFDWGRVDVDDAEMSDAKTATWICQQLDRSHNKPFFLACGIFRPHLPWYVPPKYFKPYPLDTIQLPVVKQDDLNDVPAAGKKMAKPSGDHAAVVKGDQWKKAIQGYLASIAFADAQIGRVLDALDKSEHKDNTIIVLWTDHGWHLGEKQHWRKFALWERATKTPLMIAVPKGISKTLPDGAPANTKCHSATSLLDIYPTLVDLCGLPPRDDIAGRSLASQLKQPDHVWSGAVLTTHGKGNHAIRGARWRYIRYKDGGEELYDLKNDPREWTNVAGKKEHQGTIQRLSQFLPKTEVTPGPGEGGKKSPKKAKKKQ